MVQETPRWKRRGRSYGLAASLNAAHGRVVVISPPTAVKEEGDDAVDQWRTGFDKAFTVQVQTQRESTAGRTVSHARHRVQGEEMAGGSGQ